MNAIESADPISVNDIPSILSRRKWQIVITFLFVMGAVTAFTLLTPKRYESHMKILVKNERADMIVSAGGGDGSGYHGEVNEAEINSEIELLNGNNLLQYVVLQCGLEKLENTNGSVVTERLPVAIERATTRLQHDLTITPVRKANIIQVDYSSRDPRQSSRVLRQLADSYLEEHLKVHGTPGTYQFFATQADRYQNELKEAEAKVEQYRLQHNIVMLDQQKDTMLLRASESEAAVRQADAAIGEYTYKIADNSGQLARAAPRVKTQNRAVPNQYSIEHLSSMLAELQNRRTELLAKFRPEDRLVQEVEKEIADTQATLDKVSKVTASEEATDINPVYQAIQLDLAKQQAELVGVQARRQALEQQAKAYHTQLTDLGMATAGYDDLMRTQKKAEENYLLYAKKTEEARIAESLDRQKIANVAISEPPTQPHLPSKPNVPMNLGLGVLLAGFMSFGLAFGVEYLKQPQPGVRMRMQSALQSGYRLAPVEKKSELELLTGLPVLATVYLNQHPLD